MQSEEQADSVEPKKHRFNDRLFCSDCGADAIGLQGWGKDAMVCPFVKQPANV